ncbi:hypothetical protein VTK73DRAFT_5301 [Phialemonium thermophilum]|uniref:Endonuclease/exonuclease/phosphatase domain-containing protein n=1 Tax=Phialemonium thermophilum TaxID=223376 RepID=A0ABR3V2K6_9PEZI
MQLPAKEPIPVRVVSHNIRYAATSRFPHEQPWSTRGPLLISQLAAQATSESSSSSASPSSSSSSPPLPTPSFLPHGLPVVIGLQEVLHEQLTDILNGLNAADDAAWTHLGVGRDDGATKGEYNPILYRPRQLRLLDYRTRWLSPTPDRPSFGWGAGSRRLVTVAVFEVRRRRPGGHHATAS